MTSIRAHPRAHPRHPHDDAPDTSAEFRRIAALPDGPSKEAPRQDVVRAWMPMAERLAGQYSNRGEAAEDLRQVAMVGLVKAVRRCEADVRAGMEALGGFATLSLDAEPRGADDGFRLGISQMRVSRLLSDTCARLGRQAGSGAA
ncbi:sigma factor [Streptomyces sp. DSM 41524]|uniref:Sigma factor n=1 Tax=Streptomyces asiaticus subsp. ignotus TaxID=3098222 RepID=A0ABU7PW65_9ACTN|nr:sigma factor [Streptomyces sp. DSM 41524]